MNQDKETEIITELRDKIIKECNALIRVYGGQTYVEIRNKAIKASTVRQLIEIGQTELGWS